MYHPVPTWTFFFNPGSFCFVRASNPSTQHLATHGCFISALSLQVLQNDVFAHKATVESVNKAGKDLVESSAGEEASGLQSKLEHLNLRWKDILEKTGQRKQQLKSALLQV